MLTTVFLVASVIPYAEAGDEILWSKSFAQARSESRRDGRPVLLYFTFET